MTFLLALFLALVRRRQELLALGASAATHRRALADYTRELLDQMIGPVTAATLVACMIYSVSPEVTATGGFDDTALAAIEHRLDTSPERPKI